MTEITRLQQEQSQLTEFLSNNTEKVDMYLASIKAKVCDLRIHTLNLHNLTSKLIAEKEIQVKSLLYS